jgi:hypothetical protein
MPMWEPVISPVYVWTKNIYRNNIAYMVSILWLGPFFMHICTPIQINWLHFVKKRMYLVNKYI